MSHQVKVTLKKSMQEKFKTVKEAIGVQSDAEVFRYLLNEAHKKLDASA